MTSKINFTKSALNSLAIPPSGKRFEVYDAKTRGLMVRVTSAGTKTFAVYRRVHGRPQRVKLGCYPDMTIEQARRHAGKALSKMADGIDPVIEKRVERAKSIALSTVLEAYLDAHDLKPRTISDYRLAIKESFSDWLNKPLLSISKDMVERRHRERGDKSKARTNNAMRVLRALFNYAAGKYEASDGNPLIKENPVNRLSMTRIWYKVPRRQTVIKNHQLSAWFEAVMGLQSARSGSYSQEARIYLLAVLFTGLRKEEAARLKWSDIDFAGRTFTVPDTKNRDAHTLPLPDFLNDLLAEYDERAVSEHVFPGIAQARHGADLRHWIQKVTEVSGVKFTVHDLRRTYITIAESLDISSHALKRLLNHRVSQSDVTGGYIITDVERLRTPMRKIQNHLLRLAQAKRETKVVALTR